MQNQIHEPLLECIPNLSEGRDTAALDRLWEGLGEISGLQRLHRTSDPDHHRTVLTLAGPPESIRAAVHVMFAWASKQIDLHEHLGVHPRIGALDVIPIVPLKNISPEAALVFTEALGLEISARWGVPVYLYEHSARRPERAALPDIRRGGFEGLTEKMQQPDWLPDFGPATPHPSLGASVLGVRKLLIAWNVFLQSTDLVLAQKIARQIRARNGGFAALRALGFYLPHRQQVQISMNLLDFEQTSLFVIMDAIRACAAEAGVKVAGTEFIGLVPRRALIDTAWEYLQAETGPALAGLLEEQLGSGHTL